MTKTNKDTDAAAPMDSWAMACSLLVGVRQAIAKGKAEHAAITAANPNRTFIAEAHVPRRVTEALIEIESELDRELAHVARSSNLAMPERGR